MKALTVFGTWIATLIVGLFIVLIFLQDGGTALVFTAVAAVFSLPYLVVMIIFSFVLKNFWQHQIVHVIMTIVSIIGIIVIDEKYIEHLVWVPAVYFLIGGLIQYGFWNSNNKKEVDESRKVETEA